MNQHPHHTVMYTLWVREHNRIAKELEAINTHWEDKRLFHEARRIVIAQIQHITYKSWLPFILGKAYARLKGFELKSKGYGNFYESDADAIVTNEFATAGFNFVSSLLQDKIRYGLLFFNFGLLGIFSLVFLGCMMKIAKPKIIFHCRIISIVRLFCRNLVRLRNLFEVLLYNRRKKWMRLLLMM